MHSMALLLPGPPITQITGGSCLSRGSRDAATVGAPAAAAGNGSERVVWPMMVWCMGTTMSATTVVTALAAFVCAAGCFCWLGAVSTLTMLPGISLAPLPMPATPFSSASWFSWAPRMSSTAVRKSRYTSAGARSPFTWNNVGLDLLSSTN